MDSKWQIEKNKIDMNYNQLLQKYQVICGAVYSIPLAILGIFFTGFGFNIDSLLFGMIPTMLAYIIAEDVKSKIENELENLKRMASRISI